MEETLATPNRLNALSDGVFAVIITVLALDLRPPHGATLCALMCLWPVAISYAVSYLFIAIVWINHHHVLRFAKTATPRLIWGNFAHLFTVSLIPFSTSWIAETKLGAIPVAAYAVVFILVNTTYILLCREGVDLSKARSVTPKQRKMMRMRAVATIVVFAAAAATALASPICGMGLICACLLLYLKPEAPDLSFDIRLTSSSTDAI